MTRLILDLVIVDKFSGDLEKNSESGPNPS